MTDKLKVPSTSRLILEHAIKMYESPLEKAYLDAIDFSETSRVASDIRRTCAWFSDAVCYRKKFIREAVRERLQQQAPQQVIILGAGLDPLSLHLLETYPGSISRILEVDNGYITEKKKIYDKILQEDSPLQLILCDITDTVKLYATLGQHGFQPGEPAVIVFEGVIAYITNEEFTGIMQLFQTDDLRNMIAMNYTIREDTVPEKFLPVHHQVIALLEQHISGRFNLHNKTSLLALITELGGIPDRLESLSETEKRLTGRNQVFHEPGEGIMEMASFRL
ncbi:class I SAM-dependent methyltransferase [Chitinophaga solisilvae]|uniref:class I SAM-dependent methyltransferase n=1 Tax=Chitinophaga solisilvae TaxID=1233460 RepID=UPI00136D0624|nr:class I SAM-dependent methyltransferase [Chitinophaga solisilvae]